MSRPLVGVPSLDTNQDHASRTTLVLMSGFQLLTLEKLVFVILSKNVLATKTRTMQREKE